MMYPRSINPLAAICFFLFSGFLADFSQAERALSRLKLEKELIHLRESLHEAHRELAKKAERIAELEKLIENGERSNSSSPPAKIHSKKKVATSMPLKRSQEHLNSSKSDDARPVEPKVRHHRPTPSQADENGDDRSNVEVMISFDRNSAANLKGRDRVLRLVQGKLSENPSAKFSVRGFANDSAFQETDQLIARNRARFLVDYLIIMGVPKQAFAKVEGISSVTEGAGGRKVIVKQLPAR